MKVGLKRVLHYFLIWENSQWLFYLLTWVPQLQWVEHPSCPCSSLLVSIPKQMTLPNRCSGSAHWFPPSSFWLLHHLFLNTSFSWGWWRPDANTWEGLFVTFALVIFCLVIWFTSFYCCYPYSKDKNQPVPEDIRFSFCCNSESEAIFY